MKTSDYGQFLNCLNEMILADVSCRDQLLDRLCTIPVEDVEALIQNFSPVAAIAYRGFQHISADDPRLATIGERLFNDPNTLPKDIGIYGDSTGLQFDAGGDFAEDADASAEESSSTTSEDEGEDSEDPEEEEEEGEDEDEEEKGDD